MTDDKKLSQMSHRVFLKKSSQIRINNKMLHQKMIQHNFLTEKENTKNCLFQSAAISKTHISNQVDDKRVLKLSNFRKQAILYHLNNNLTMHNNKEGKVTLNQISIQRSAKQMQLLPSSTKRTRNALSMGFPSIKTQKSVKALSIYTGSNFNNKLQKKKTLRSKIHNTRSCFNNL